MKKMLKNWYKKLINLNTCLTVYDNFNIMIVENVEEDKKYKDI